MVQGRTSGHLADWVPECCSSTHSARSQTTDFAHCCCEWSFFPNDLDQSRRFHCSRVKLGCHFHSKYLSTCHHWPRVVKEPSWLNPYWQILGRGQSGDHPCSPEWGFSASSCCLCFRTHRTHLARRISASHPDLDFAVDFDLDFAADQRRLAAGDWNPGTSILEILHSAAPQPVRLRLRFPVPRPFRTRVSRPPELVRVSLTLFAGHRPSHEGPPLLCLQRRKKSAKLAV